MIMDKSTSLADQVSVAKPVGTYLLGHVLDTHAAGFDTDIDLLIAVGFVPIITAAGAGTLQFALATDATASISTTGGAQIL